MRSCGAWIPERTACVHRGRSMDGFRGEQKWELFGMRRMSEKGRGAAFLGMLVLVMAVFFATAAWGAKIEKVHPYYYAARMNRTVTVKGKKIPSGSKVTAKSRKGKKAQIIYKGKTYTVPTSAFNSYDFVTRGKKPYKKATAEHFVNKKGYKSKSGYLVWISTYTQHLYVFTGKRHHWKLFKHAKCGTGKFEKPTMNGPSKITYKRKWCWTKKELNHGAYYCCRIRGGLIHSWIYNMSSKRRISRERLGRPVSLGCVRVNIKFAKWLYKNLPLNTLAVVY